MLKKAEMSSFPHIQRLLILNQSNKTKGLVFEVRALGSTLKENFWASKYFLKC